MGKPGTLTGEEFGAHFQNFLEQLAVRSSAGEPPFRSRLRSHFGAEPSQYPIVAEEFERSEHPNLQLAIDGFLAEEGRSSELLGVTSDQNSSYRGVGLSELLAPPSTGHGGHSSHVPGPVEYTNVVVSQAEVLPCVQRGLYLIQGGDRRLALLVRGPSEMSFRKKIHVEVMAPDRADAERFLGGVRAAMRKRNVYRGGVVSLAMDAYGDLHVQFHRLAKVDRAQIILPSGLLERIERQTVRFARHSEKLLAAGRHLRRGILLHGPPGTGKTFTAMYLAGQMSDRTVLLLTGRGLGTIEQSCAMANALQPAMVILEDVDLVAEERTRPGASCTVLLFELLNQMDGLADDSDVIFLLTTNRPDILEPALASRPGRVDQAIEIPLPDSDCRRRLFALYSRGLMVRADNLELFIERTEGASAAFIRELMRKAALFAAEEGAGGGEAIEVENRHIGEALHELVIQGGQLTQSLLGVKRSKTVYRDVGS